MKDKYESKKLRLQDVADIVGVSRTTVSNVVHGKTKKVSLETIKKVTKILDEQGYVPNMSSRILSSNISKIIGVVLSDCNSHGFYQTMDPFVGEFLGAVEEEARHEGYYIMLMQGLSVKEVADVASRWNIDGLIVLFLSLDEYVELTKKLNKNIVLVDTYDNDQYADGNYKESVKPFYNVGINDYEGGRLIGRHLVESGYTNAIFAAGSMVDSDFVRWLGFKKEMESTGIPCEMDRYKTLAKNKESRIWKLKKLIPSLLNTHKAIAFSSDYNAVEAINYFNDQKIKVPEQISVTGFDNNQFCEVVRPRLTTVSQDVTEKGKKTVRRLVQLIHNETVEEYVTRGKVKLIVRDSVYRR